ncbi:hypothetical protein Ocin01_11207 [Orchesella cincta]|uniref:Uncharacterized protein n=1 Tax=Orchesella cincta TaxID=48709 RepID=A0A1D2MR55_ORCCI|nr:hypothetical protein Ocin01_11207 [Orchesella cincta]
MVDGCCCMKTQSTVLATSGLLIVGWTVQLILSIDRFVSAIKWSHDNPDHKEIGATQVGVSGLLVIVDSSQTVLSMLLLSAVFMRDLNKLQPWFILTALNLTAYIPLSIVSCFVEVTSQPEFILAWILILMSLYAVWLASEFKKEFTVPSMERLL